MKTPTSKPASCPHCGCASAAHADAHAIVLALLQDNLDQALQLGLLQARPCPDCTPACHAALSHAQCARQTALAARERHHARNLRLARIKATRDAARKAAARTTQTIASPALPSAAAAALARAMAKAQERRP